MTITITKMSNREVPEHWRVLVTEGEIEVYHDSARSKLLAVSQVLLWLNVHYK
jgi:hypothetical protein